MRARHWILLATLLFVGIPTTEAWATKSGSHGSSSGGTVHVHGYYRKDGTYVHPYDRSAPGLESPSTPSYTPRSSRGPSHTPDSYWAYGGRNSSRLSSPSEPGTEFYGLQRDAHGRVERSTGAKDAFRRQHPCPSTGRSTGPCPGYVIDHIQALKHGGADKPSNMQCQTIADAKAKDRWE